MGDPELMQERTTFCHLCVWIPHSYSYLKLNKGDASNVRVAILVKF